MLQNFWLVFKFKTKKKMPTWTCAVQKKDKKVLRSTVELIARGRSYCEITYSKIPWRKICACICYCRIKLLFSLQNICFIDEMEKKGPNLRNDFNTNKSPKSNSMYDNRRHELPTVNSMSFSSFFLKKFFRMFTVTVLRLWQNY